MISIYVLYVERINCSPDVSAHRSRAQAEDAILALARKFAAGAEPPPNIRKLIAALAAGNVFAHVHKCELAGEPGERLRVTMPRGQRLEVIGFDNDTAA